MTTQHSMHGNHNHKDSDQIDTIAGSGHQASPQHQRMYASNPNKRRRIRVIPLWLEKHARPVGSDPLIPNSVNDPEALEELIECVAQGNIVAVRLLAEAGVNLNMKDSNGWTPLHHAVANGQHGVEELLVEKGGGES